ncbi:MAG: RNA polymerase sigma factor [Spirochaetes bacterium]|nr:RNA polymerase sigma factor [Spirochaetota bacterium]MBU0954296.1 RNA polymerase sigma factor [Spirochaetota bacterium]
MADTELIPDALWRTWQPALSVYLFSFRSLLPEDREEVLQDTWAALCAAGRIVGPGDKALAYRIVRNKAIDLLRWRKRQDSHVLHPAKDPEPFIKTAFSAHAGPEQAYLRREELQLVQCFLSGLKDRERELLHLVFAEGFSYPQISRLLAIPLGSVKWKVARLRRQLAESYEQEFS